MKKSIAVVVSSLALVGPATAGITVPGTSDMWLAGMPAGSTASLEDSAPGQSPVLVPVVAGTTLSFTVTGMVSNGPCCALVGPDGNDLTGHSSGDENGIANVASPINALMGVFLDDSAPNLSPTPGALDFSAGGLGTSFLSLSPGLKQVFFIGDGRTASFVTQTFLVPAGATRLFLGTMDGYGWWNNLGSYDVTVAVPEPETYAMLLAGLGALGMARRRRGG